MFAGFVSADSKIAIDQIATLQGKIVGIIGTIELHQGKPEIKVTSMHQIVLLWGQVGHTSHVAQ